MLNEKRRILPHSSSAIDRLRPQRWAAAAVGGFSLLGMVAAFAFAPPANDPHPGFQTVLERLPAPRATVIETGNSSFLREERIQHHDTVASLLNRLGIVDHEVGHFLRSDRQGRRLVQQLRPGVVVTVNSGQSGELRTLQIPLAGKDAMLVIERHGKGFAVREQAMKLELQTAVRSGAIDQSWVGATNAAGVPDAIASQLIGIFGSQLDFQRDLRQGDRFSLVYEILTHRGQAIRSGRILAAEISCNGRTLQAYWFAPQNSEGAYYTADGRSLQATFLRDPIESSQVVNSSFAGARLHPILQTWRAHKGVDYAAPAGTPVLAVADGTVDAADYQNGYGKLLVLKHHGAYSSAYGHLREFAAGLNKGVHVRQGETIGYVGQSGLATGPHLHYELRVNDEQIDPLALAMPVSIPLEGSQRARYMGSSQALRAQLGLASSMILATIE